MAGNQAAISVDAVCNVVERVSNCLVNHPPSELYFFDPSVDEDFSNGFHVYLFKSLEVYIAT